MVERVEEEYKAAPWQKKLHKRAGKATFDPDQRKLSGENQKK